MIEPALSPDDQDRALKKLHADALRELVEGGLDTVRVYRARALTLAGEPGEVEGRIASLSVALDRAERSVRRAVAMGEKLREGTLVAEMEAREARKAAAQERAETIAKARNDLRDAAYDLIHTAERPEGEPERLSDDAEEWLDNASDDDFFAKPVGEMLAILCHDLGFALDLSAVSATDWAEAERNARSPTSPFTRYRHRDNQGPNPALVWSADPPERTTEPEPAGAHGAAKPP